MLFRSGYATLPDFIRNIVVAKLIASVRCTNGEYALAEYVLSPVNILSPVDFSAVLSSYLSVYSAIAPNTAWNMMSGDDSRSLWRTFISSKATSAGLFTLFSGSTQRLKYYTDNLILSSAFAHIAVVTVYHLDRFTSCSSSTLRITDKILGGIYCGTIKYWNDSLIQQANSAHSSCLPQSKINVVVRSGSSDSNSIFLRYLTLISPDFQAAYTASGGDSDYRSFDFSTLIPSHRLVQVSSNGYVDNEVVVQDLSIGYYLHVSPPTSNVALYCADSTCTTSPIIPNDMGASISMCQSDSSTIINPTSNVYSYDLMISDAPGCYPIVGTLDYSVYTHNDPQTCGTVNLDFISQKVQLGAFFYNGSAIVKPLSMLSSAPSSDVQRHKTYTNICDMTCDTLILGYTYCGYRDCSWLDGDYTQVVSECEATTQRRQVTYQFSNQSDSCTPNPSTIPPLSTSIGCPYLLQESNMASGVIFMCVFGSITCAIILHLSYRYRHEQVLKRSQLVFIYIFLIGAILMNLTVLCMYGRNSDTNCMLRVWAVNLSSTIMFAPLIMKLHRVDVLYRTLQKGGRRKRISDFTVGLQVLGLVCVDLIILIVWTSLERPRQISIALTYPNIYAPVVQYICSTSIDQTCEKVMVAWKAALLAFGIMKAIQTWSVPEEISEAKYFAIAIYNIAVVGSFTYFLSVFGNVDVEVVVILRSVGLFISATVSATVIMIPKLLITQLSWAEVFLGTRTSYKEEEDYSSSVPTPRTIGVGLGLGVGVGIGVGVGVGMSHGMGVGAVVMTPKANGTPIQGKNLLLNLEKVHMSPMSPIERRI